MFKNVLSDLLNEVEEYYNSELSYIFHQTLDGKYKSLVDNKEYTIHYFEKLGYKCEIDKPYLTYLIHIYRINKRNNEKQESNKVYSDYPSFYERLGYAAYQYTNYLMCGGSFC